MTYGCEVWGYDRVYLLEKGHLLFIKQSLQLKESTGNMFVYGELGRHTLSIEI